MKILRLLPALLPLLGIFLPTTSAQAGTPLDLDGGLRAAIYDDNYKLGVGGQLGLVCNADSEWDIGLHVNYTYFAHKTQGWDDANETGGYVTAYYLPALDQAFKLRIGPHIGGAYIRHPYVDVGGDAMALFQASKEIRFYGAFVPSFFIGPSPQTLFRVGIGLEYGIGG